MGPDSISWSADCSEHLSIFRRFFIDLAVLHNEPNCLDGPGFTIRGVRHFHIPPITVTPSSVGALAEELNKRFELTLPIKKKATVTVEKGITDITPMTSC